MKVLTLLLVALVTAGCTSATSGESRTSAPSYAGGRSACAEFGTLVADAGRGILNFSELREKAKAVQSRASTAEPEINKASTSILALLTAQGSSSAILAAFADMKTACDKYNYPSYTMK